MEAINTILKTITGRKMIDSIGGMDKAIRQATILSSINKFNN